MRKNFDEKVRKFFEENKQKIVNSISKSSGVVNEGLAYKRFKGQVEDMFDPDFGGDPNMRTSQAIKKVMRTRVYKEQKEFYYEDIESLIKKSLSPRSKGNKAKLEIDKPLNRKNGKFIKAVDNIEYKGKISIVDPRIGMSSVYSSYKVTNAAGDEYYVYDDKYHTNSIITTTLPEDIGSPVSSNKVGRPSK